MGFNDYDDYEYVDDDDYDYYDDDEEYIDYSEDDEEYDDDESIGSSLRSSIKPFGSGSSGLPGSSSSGSRFGGSGSSASRFGGGSKSDTSGSTSRFGGSGTSSRFGSSSSKKDDDKKSPSGSSSRFGGSGSSSRFGGSSSSKDDNKSSSSSSRFGGSSSSRFGGSSSSSSSSSSRFGGGAKKDDDKKSPSGSSSRFGGSGSSSRFGGNSSSKDDSKSSSSSSRFGGSSSSSSSSSSSRFGGGAKKDDDKSSSSSSRFGGSSSSRFGGNSKKDDSKSSSSSSRFGGGAKKDDKKDAKKDGDSSGGLGSMLGGITSRFGSGGDDKKDNKKDAKKDGDSGGGLGSMLGGITSRFGSGGDDKKDSKKDNKSSSGGGRFGSSSAKSDSKKDDKSSSGGGRFGGFGRNNDKSDDKKDNKSSSGGGRFGRFGGNNSKSDDKKDSKPAAKQSALGAKKSSGSSNKGAKTAAATAKAESSGGIFGRVSSAIGGVFGGSSDDSASKPASSRSKSSKKVPKTKSDDGLTLDNWLDIIGVGLVVGSLVLFFSAISQEQAAIGAIHELLGDIFGWGAISIPVVMFIVGVWLIVRHFGEEAPTVDPIRVVGVVITFITTLVLFQYIDTFGYNVPRDITNQELLQDWLRHRLNDSWNNLHTGGGWIGAEIYFLLYTTVTEIGGFFLMIFAYIIGAMLITRMSAAEIVRAIGGMILATREGMKKRAVEKRAERQIALQQAAEEQARLAAAGITPQTQNMALATATAGAETDAAGREIRMTMGGHAQTVSMSGQQNGQVAQQNYGPPMRAMPMQAAPPANNGNGGLFGRLGGGFSLFGRGNGNSVNTPPPPSALPETPLPMDDGYSHFDNTPRRQAAPTAQQPQRLGDMLREQPNTTQQPAASINTPKVTEEPVKPVNPQVQVEKEAEDVSNFLKERQQRLNDLRDGKTGPLSQSAMARAKQDDVSAAFVPSNEAKREEDFSSKFGTGIGEAARAEAKPIAGDGSSTNFTPPSTLPSAQADGDTSPKQQMLSVPVEKPKSSKVQSSKARPNWRLPDYRTLLSSGSEQEFDREYLLKQAKIIEETLESFGAPGRVVEVNTGPVITQFGVEPDYVSGRSGRKQRVKVSAIAGLDKDLQLALGARSIRVEAPVPGKGYVGVEVPNAETTTVALRDVMDSPSFSKHKTPLAIALGQSVSGAPISADLSTMPHLLIAGTTGSGKSVCVNSIIASIISRNTPEQVKFIMVDPKRVELTGYNGIPHLVAPVVVDLERIVGVLKWVTREMDARYKQFSDAGARNIEDFNKHRDPNSTEQMPYMVVIIDELADLMMLAPEETERTITRIAALARATGIHLVIATQRPSVDVVTGLIKANFPARIAFAVAGSVDSRVILDQPGAERLLGKGDMLYLSGDSPAPLRLQGVFVSDMEINNIVRYWKMQGMEQPSTSSLNLDAIAPAAKSIPMKQQSSSNNSGGAFWDNDEGEDDDLPLFAAAKRNSENSSSEDVELTKRELTGDVKEGNEDDLYDRAVELVRRLDKASISLLQRRLRIGYTRAARLIDVMEARGVVGPSKDGSSKPRDVLPET